MCYALVIGSLLGLMLVPLAENRDSSSTLTVSAPVSLSPRNRFHESWPRYLPTTVAPTTVPDSVVDEPRVPDSVAPVPVTEQQRVEPVAAEPEAPTSGGWEASWYDDGPGYYVAQSESSPSFPSLVTLRVCRGSNCVEVLIRDVCGGCHSAKIDLSRQAFAALAPLSQGIMYNLSVQRI